METGDERRRRERRIMEKKLRRTRMECRILAAAAILLAGALAVQVMKKNADRDVANTSRVTVREGDGGAEQGAGDSSAEWENADSGTGQGDAGGAGLAGTDASHNSWILTEEDLLILVNKDHKLPDGYQVELHWLQNRSSAVAELMYDALKAMLTDGSTDGREYVVASGYRSSETQRQLLEEDVYSSMESEGLTYQEAYEKETRETMPPGYSEHETGLAVDIVALDYQILDEEQETTGENQWLREHCSEYGFILRYPRGSEEITGIDYEPWHFRYVGLEAAKEITGAGITLEEYLEKENGSF